MRVPERAPLSSLTTTLTPTPTTTTTLTTRVLCVVVVSCVHAVLRDRLYEKNCSFVRPD
jgi:hypothetical protein